ncbi:hypothetical protein [Stygiolobus caldivivus]|uniref:Uncharacterized protein n=1 Tax=Stygiolobus caldivivus TaxID=2824673 RepID=A0A8D5U817_9CREN|nr:hypothetical protein [Stygiolobus caldivivus]BCU71058.1 hypothetical protein KN1_23550 [Stygiolobus caldivivus]
MGSKRLLLLLISILVSAGVLVTTLFLAPVFISTPISPSINAGSLNVITQGNWTAEFKAIITREGPTYTISFSNGTSLSLSSPEFVRSTIGKLLASNMGHEEDSLRFFQLYIYYYVNNYNSSYSILIIKAYFSQGYHQVPYQLYLSVRGVRGVEGPYYWAGNYSYWVAYSNQTSSTSVLTVIKTTNFTISIEQYKSILELVTTSNDV